MINIFPEEVCNVGNTARILTRFGYGDDYRVRKLYDWLLEDRGRMGAGTVPKARPGRWTAGRRWPPLPLCRSRSDPGRLRSPSREELSSIWKEDCSRKGESTSLGSDSTIRITSTTTFWLGLTSSQSSDSQTTHGSSQLSRYSRTSAEQTELGYWTDCTRI